MLSYILKQRSLIRLAAMKNWLFSVTLLFCLALQPASAARPKLYYYDGDAPMIEMMLNMMVAMGMIDKVPPGYLRDGVLARSNGFRSRYGVPGWNSMLASPWAGSMPGLWSGGLPGSYAGSNPFDKRVWSKGINCLTTPCVKASALDGIWISSTGEMLGIKRNRILWSDGEDNHVSGVFAAAPDYIIVQLDGSSRKLPYEYHLQGNQLKLKDAQGKIRRFYRLPGSNYY